jgi:hypothetical protein
MDRYFTVWFKGFDENDERREGSMQVIGKNGNYINEEELLNMVSNNYNLSGVFINNFVEFPSEKDFKTYVNKKKGIRSKFKFW